MKANSKKLVLIDINKLRPSSVQPRHRFDDERLIELAHSIETHGILQPIIARTAGAELEIVAGERRWRAAKIAQLKEVPCIVMDLVTNEAMAIALIENIQREDLNPIEEAHAYLKLKESLLLNQEEVAERVGKDRATVANTMRLLRLPKQVQEMVIEESLSMGHARALLAIESADLMLMVAKKIVREGLSVRRTEALIRSLKNGYQLGDSKPVDPLQKEIQQKLEGTLGTKVNLRKEGNGYAMVIYFSDTNHLNGLLDILGVEI
jgi:ParB family chromosome partitioning protein